VFVAGCNFEFSYTQKNATWKNATPEKTRKINSEVASVRSQACEGKIKK